MTTTTAGRLDELSTYFAGRREALIGSLARLVEIESPSDDSAAVSAVAAFVADRLAERRVAAEAVPCAGRGNGLVARLGESRGGTLLLGHIDTVWPVGTLAERPFRIENGVATGPGVFDMKAGVAVAMDVLGAIAEGVVKPKAGVSLFLTPDEEIGSEASRDFFVEEALRRHRVFVLEPSGDGGAAKIARKGVGLVNAHFIGVASHAGLEPEKGASALVELSRFVLFADALGDRALGTSVVPTVAKAGTKANVVPDSADVVVDFRVWTREEGDRVSTALASYSAGNSRVKLQIEGGLNRPPMEPTTESLALYERASSLARHLGFAMEAARVGGGSDGNLTAAAGVPTLDGLGPSGGGAHARSEHLNVDDLPRRAALLAALLEEVVL
ncbi:MAG TPA: M20/M25/M40 family metallo-hydrolase [Thermoanaerobaculia bacterium]|nr:M20/M25/M40 family metallo-hydrolase [Thermoanaerobaculia bacterium]